MHVMHTHLNTYMHAYAHMNILINTHIHAYVCTHTHMHMHICMNVHMHTPINTHAHIHLHRKECIFCLMVMKVKRYEQHRDRVGVLVLPLGDRPKLLGDTQGMRRGRKHFQASLYPHILPLS